MWGWRLTAMENGFFFNQIKREIPHIPQLSCVCAYQLKIHSRDSKVSVYSSRGGKCITNFRMSQTEIKVIQPKGLSKLANRGNADGAANGEKTEKKAAFTVQSVAAHLKASK
jgi:hypothetical protein